MVRLEAETFSPYLEKDFRDIDTGPPTEAAISMAINSGGLAAWGQLLYQTS
jgi:hypothetical protein